MNRSTHAVVVGSDEVSFEGERVIIRASHPMDWPIRGFCRVAILVQGRKYYLRSKEKGPGARLMLYELWPWPADCHDSPARVVVYDEAYVAERDGTATGERHRELLHLALVPFYPLLGLLWSGVKSRFLIPLGFELGSVTRASIALTFNLFIAEGIFVGWLASGILTRFLGRPALRPVDWVLMLLLGADSALRFGQSLKLDVIHYWGFLEWAWLAGKGRGQEHSLPR